jgi:hypothetical protein
MVITGDLTANAKRDDFEILRKIFLHFGLLNTDKYTSEGHKMDLNSASHCFARI